MTAFNKVSVLIPTRCRTHRLRTLIDSYRRTIGDNENNSEMVFRVDNDDEPSRALLESEGFRMIVGPRLQGYQSLPFFFNELAMIADGDVLMCGNDDMVFMTPGWALRLLAVANNFPDGLFDLGVTTHNETHYPFANVSKRVCDKLGFLCDPDIFWVDIYIRDVMAAFGRTVMVPDVAIEHDWAGFRPDQTFNEGGHRNVIADRPDYWTHVHPQAVSRAVAALREMHQ